MRTLEKEPDTRTDAECKELLPLVVNFGFMAEWIKKFNENEIKQVANGLEMRKILKDERIFQAGDSAEEFFVIIRGQVGILYPKQSVYEYQRLGTFDKTVIGMRQKYVAGAIQDQIFITRRMMHEEAQKEDQEEKDKIVQERKQKAMETNYYYQ